MPSLKNCNGGLKSHVRVYSNINIIHKLDVSVAKTASCRTAKELNIIVSFDYCNVCTGLSFMTES